MRRERPILHRLGLKRSATRLARDTRGVSAVEFALIFPLMLLLYVGAIETGNLLTANRRVMQVASTAADLTAQVKTVSTQDLGDIVKAAGLIMSPNAPRIVITSVVADQNNNGKVDWSYASSGAARAKNSSYPVPTGLTDPGTSVVVAEVTYPFTPLLNLTGIFSPGSFTLSRTFYTRPRKSLTVACTNC
jgi:Flp pilus assembly protein TadG